MEKPFQQVVWEECIDEERCIKIFGKKHCVRIGACIRIVHESANYYLEIDAFGQRWRWNLTNACYVFYEVGIARFKICAEPKAGNKGVRLALEGCIGVDGVSKCWTLFAQDVTWFKASDLTGDQLEILGVDRLIGSKRTGTKESLKAVGEFFGSMQGDLDEDQITAVLAAPAT